VPLWFDLEDPHRFLYHYTTREAALGSILPAAELRVGLFRYMNDPREAKGWSFTIEGGPSLSPADVLALNQEATALAKSTSKVLSFTRDDPTSAGEGFGEFGRGYAHSALWAHYAGEHSGVCLVFDADALRQPIEQTLGPKGRLYAGCVTYADAATEEIEAFTLSYSEVERLGVPGAVEEHIRRWHPILFFRKSLEWLNEREYRWLLRSPEPAPEFVSIRDSLRGLVLGHDFPRGDLDSVDHLAQSFPGLSIRWCKWDNGIPKIIPHPMPAGAVSMNFRFRAAGFERPSPPPSLEVRVPAAPTDGEAQQDP
jgi:hypothetical protein